MNMYQERWDTLVNRQRLFWITETDLSPEVIEELTNLRIIKGSIEGDPNTGEPCLFILHFQHKAGQMYSLSILQRYINMSTLDYDVSFKKGECVLLFADLNGTKYRIPEKPTGYYKETDLLILRDTFFQRFQCQIRNIIKAIARQQKNVS